MTKPAPKIDRPLSSLWTFEQITPWMKKHATPGMIVIIEQTQAGFWHYLPAEIVSIQAKPWKMELKAATGIMPGSDNFYASGKSCFYPTGQTRALPPFPEAVEAALNVWTWHWGRPSSIGHAGCKTPRAIELRERLAAQEIVARAA